MTRHAIGTPPPDRQGFPWPICDKGVVGLGVVHPRPWPTHGQWENRFDRNHIHDFRDCVPCHVWQCRPCQWVWKVVVEGPCHLGTRNNCVDACNKTNWRLSPWDCANSSASGWMLEESGHDDPAGLHWKAFHRHWQQKQQHLMKRWSSQQRTQLVVVEVDTIPWRAQIHVCIDSAVFHHGGLHWQCCQCCVVVPVDPNNVASSPLELWLDKRSSTCCQWMFLPSCPREQKRCERPLFGSKVVVGVPRWQENRLPHSISRARRPPHNALAESNKSRATFESRCVGVTFFLQIVLLVGVVVVVAHAHVLAVVHALAVCWAAVAAVGCNGTLSRCRQRDTCCPVPLAMARWCACSPLLVQTELWNSILMVCIFSFVFFSAACVCQLQFSMLLCCCFHVSGFFSPTSRQTQTAASWLENGSLAIVFTWKPSSLDCWCEWCGRLMSGDIVVGQLSLVCTCTTTTLWQSSWSSRKVRHHQQHLKIWTMNPTRQTLQLFQWCRSSCAPFSFLPKATTGKRHCKGPGTCPIAICGPFPWLWTTCALLARTLPLSTNVSTVFWMSDEKVHDCHPFFICEPFRNHDLVCARQSCRICEPIFDKGFMIVVFFMGQFVCRPFAQESKTKCMNQFGKPHEPTSWNNSMNLVCCGEFQRESQNSVVHQRNHCHVDQRETKISWHQC